MLVYPAVLMLTFSNLFAADDSETKYVTPQPDEQCSKEVLMSFFPKPIVTDVLTENKISNDKITVIVSELAKQNDSIIKMVQEKASKMDPNPLKDPAKREEAAKIFKGTILDVFGNVLKAQGVTDEAQIKTMLDTIQERKAKLFADCMQKMQPKKPQTMSSQQ